MANYLHTVYFGTYIFYDIDSFNQETSCKWLLLKYRLYGKGKSSEYNARKKHLTE